MGIQKLKFAAIFWIFWLLIFSMSQASAAEDEACVGSDHKQLASGTWRGFYRYENGSSVDQLIELRLNGSELTGSGSDAQVGSFTIKGFYSRDTGRVSFVKTYATHSVKYEGDLADGTIVGSWNLPEIHGTFQFTASCKGKGGKVVPSQSGPALLLQ